MAAKSRESRETGVLRLEVKVSIVVDRDAWADEYHLPDDQVNEDARKHFEQVCVDVARFDFDKSPRSDLVISAYGDAKIKKVRGLHS